MKSQTQFCYCGRPLAERFGILRCPTHQLEWFKPNYGGKKKKGKYSGPSKKYKGGYEVS